MDTEKWLTYREVNENMIEEYKTIYLDKGDKLKRKFPEYLYNLIHFVVED